jgi:hydroxyacylglutathione hydrolase
MKAEAPMVIPVVDEGLGNSTYLVDLGDSRALVVDPGRDLRAVRRRAARAGLRITHVADTHLHADFLSGAVQLAATGDVTVLASAAGGRGFPHRGLRDGDEVDLGGLRLRALATPGHTLEHLAFLLLDSDGGGETPVGVFTGGSLIVGSAARTDLVDPARTRELGQAQYVSVMRLLTLPDATVVWPTHGAGSFCSAPPGADRVSTIAREKATNPLLAAVGGARVDQGTFVARLLAGLGNYPPYFDRLGEVNRVGPSLVTEPVGLAGLDVDAVRAALDGGGRVVDVRPVAEFAAGHLPGSISIPLRPAFATWLGWLTTADRPIVVVRDVDQDPAEITWQALKIGYENLVGQLTGGVAAWRVAGQPVRTIPLVAADQRVNGAVLDVRQAGEFTAGHLPGALHIELGELAAAPQTGLPWGPLVVMCGHGERAMSAASLLSRAGRRDVIVRAGGPDDWAATTGIALQTGP